MTNRMNTYRLSQENKEREKKHCQTYIKQEQIWHLTNR
jgi:hypothetical protein